MAFLLFLPFQSPASPLVNTEDHPESMVTMSELDVNHTYSAKELRSSQKAAKKQLRTERQIERIEKFIANRMVKKSPSGLSDPVNRFFWYWILGWGAGLLLTLLTGGAITTGGLAILWFTLFIGGAVSLVLWLVKRFG